MPHKWVLLIHQYDGGDRAYPLDHEYETSEEAEREAEDIADCVFSSTDMGWSLRIFPKEEVQ